MVRREHRAIRTSKITFLIDHTLDFVEFLGDGGTIKGISGANKTLGGYDPEQLIGTHYPDILHPQDCAAAAAAFGRVLRGEPVAPITLRYRHQDGTWRTVQSQGRNFLHDPAVRAAIILTRDMTDQLNAEASLATANIELPRLSQRLIVVQKEERHRIARELHDDVHGVGFDVRAARASALAAGSVGLLSMRERAALVGARLEVNSSMGHHTDVRALFHIGQIS